MLHDRHGIIESKQERVKSYSNVATWVTIYPTVAI
jgi:hypothetical protein